MASSSSNSSDQNSFAYDVFISFRGNKTHLRFVYQLYAALMDKGIKTFHTEKCRIGNVYDHIIEDSKSHIIVFSQSYASSPVCLNELVQIMECHEKPGYTAYAVFYDVERNDVRYQTGAVGEAFLMINNEKRAEIWKQALIQAADLDGWVLEKSLDWHKFINKIVEEISIIKHWRFDYTLVGMERRLRNVLSFLELAVEDEVRMIGFKGMGGAGKTILATVVFSHLYAEFECKSFVQQVREVSHRSEIGLKSLQEQVIFDVLKERVTLADVTDGQNVMKQRMHDKKVILLLDDVDQVEQLQALADPKWFKPGSIILITTRDKQVLSDHGVRWIHNIDLLSKNEAISLFSRGAFDRENPPQEYEKLTKEVLTYAAGLPLTLDVLGPFLYGTDKLVWADAIDRLKKIPVQKTLKSLELSYYSLDNADKDFFEHIACILNGQHIADAIVALECCGFEAEKGLKGLENKSLLTVDVNQLLCMHPHIEEMGKNIVRRYHPNEPNKHSHLWNQKEIEKILANDTGTGETRWLKHNFEKGDLKILMKGLGKMTKLNYLEVEFTVNSDSRQLDESNKCFPNSLRYFKSDNYPFLYLPKTFQPNNLVGLHMRNSKMVNLWEEGDQKVLQKLKYLSLYQSHLRTFDLKLTPNIETLSIRNCFDFEELRVYATCPNLKFLSLCGSQLRSLDLELIPNLEYLDLQECSKLLKIDAPDGCLKKFVELNLRGCALLEKLPEDLGRFGCLKKLDITDTNISHLPDSILGLEGLCITASSKKRPQA